jgi:curved DNA-binding protein CbpA
METAQLNSDDLYARLGVVRTASTDDIKRAYRALVRQYPPERAPEAFKRIREAYETIGSPESRAEYDRGPGAEIVALLAKANAEMQQQQYASAERLIKRVLLEDPTLSYARNLLGLCYLYQEKADEAIVQYSRLLKEPDATAAWYGNAAHAYRLAKRFKEAELAFAESVKRSPSDAVDRYVAWAEMYVELEQPDKARALLEKAVKADGKEAFDDLPLLLKLLELDLSERRASGVTRMLRRVREVSVDDAQKIFAAWKLATLSWQLILARRFRAAELVAGAARELQPADTDYDALCEVASSLETNALQRTARTVRSHIAFAKDGWLAKLGPALLQYCEEHAAYEGMRRIDEAPGLRTVNGFGTMLYGNRDHDARTETYVATVYFCALFIPVIPLACYRVRSAGSGWQFVGKVPFGKAQKWQLGVLGAALFFWIVTSALGSAADTAAASSMTGFTAAPTAASPSETTPYVPYGGPGPAAAQPASVFEGTVTNDGFPKSPASLRIALKSTADTAVGEVEIGPPLGGSGHTVIVSKPDSLLMVSWSQTGDTIVWGARKSGDRYRGRYRIVGGQSRDQTGAWTVRHSVTAP